MKMSAWIRQSNKSYFWRNFNQREVDYVEIANKQLSAFEIKWNTTKNHKVTRAFTNLYPDSKTEVITPENFVGFIGI